MAQWLVGNGFDLHHEFPTRYIDFLHTIVFLIDNKSKTYTTVGEVFGDKKLQNTNKFIRTCYEKHKDIYNSTPLDDEKIKILTSLAENNVWFKYLLSCVSKDIGWIDFEKEILRLLNTFENFLFGNGFTLTNQSLVVFNSSAYPKDNDEKHIISYFDFFFDKQVTNPNRHQVMKIKEDYIIEKLAGAGTYCIDIEKVVSKLYELLRVLSNILKEYLLYFVEAPLNKLVELGIKPNFKGLFTPHIVYSFNYTNVFEELYNKNIVYHIHGNLESDIVLGINPNEKDNLGTIDTTFLQFKKYYQRVFYETDIEFLREVAAQKQLENRNNEDLIVIGHSLDSTDEDVIKQIFGMAKSIKILYHRKSSVKNQIRNLVEIFGKEGLDKLREEKSLVFLPQPEIEWVYPEVKN